MGVGSLSQIAPLANIFSTFYVSIFSYLQCPDVLLLVRILCLLAGRDHSTCVICFDWCALCFLLRNVFSLVQTFRYLIHSDACWLFAVLSRDLRQAR